MAWRRSAFLCPRIVLIDPIPTGPALHRLLAPLLESGTGVVELRSANGALVNEMYCYGKPRRTR